MCMCVREKEMRERGRQKENDREDQPYNKWPAMFVWYGR